MNTQKAADTLLAMLERCQGNLIAIPEDEEVTALEVAIKALEEAAEKRNAEIGKAVRMIKEIGGWPDKDIQEIWEFLRDKLRYSEEMKREIKSRLGIE